MLAVVIIHFAFCIIHLKHMVYYSGGTQLLNPEKIYQHLGLTQGMRVADLGCGGTGRFTITAAKLVGRRGLVYAVDILKSILAEVALKARLEGIANVKTVWANLEIYNATKIKSDSLDIGFLVNILFQSKEDDNVIKESSRMIKRGGRLLVIDWKQVSLPFGPPLVDRVKPETVKKICKSLNLKLIDEFDAGAFHYCLIFQK